MRYAILSDIHGNAAALRAVLADLVDVSNIYSMSFDQIWCLGDVVGYGPEPGACVRHVRARCDICIPGNHDWAVIGKLDLEDFSEAATQSVMWTRERLSQDEHTYLKLLPEITRIGDFTLAHGSPANPIWEYLITPDSAAPNFAAFDTPFCVVGHTHLPCIFLQPADAQTPYTSQVDSQQRRTVGLAMTTPGGPTFEAMERAQASSTPAARASTCKRLVPSPGLWMLPPGYRAIINPGSVGQPRDGDPRASYLIYDSACGFEFRRVHYDIRETQRKIHESGLSPKLASRLAKGI